MEKKVVECYYSESSGERNNIVNVTIDRRRSLRHPRDTAGIPYTARIRMQMRRIGKYKWIVRITHRPQRNDSVLKNDPID